MSVFAVLHRAALASAAARHDAAAGRGLRAVLSEVVDRLAASPLDHPVLGAVAAQRPAGPPARSGARRRPVAAGPALGQLIPPTRARQEGSSR
ncbi:hypothetical protein GCM10010430_57340 [Kitasatospora cystarginea]|uniref:Uncharacterized protein n=1 Tax=Kitasatospora cystarginea TaxID=58350 RepID=A0ABP5RKG3_9ACTN